MSSGQQAGRLIIIWTVQDLLRYHVPPAPDAAPNRGRPPKAKTEVVSGSRRRGRPPKPRPAEAAA